ncbi:hypothetical protein LGMT14_00772 [Lactococcus garvieae]|nr:hypothetical protein LGMT14_00772 [Lactococcus garvieae]
MAHPDPESTSIILQILLLVFLTALNAFFSASEMYSFLYRDRV